MDGLLELGAGTPNPKQGLDPEPSIIIEGDLIVEGGTIEVEVAGLGDGQFGLLEVTGTADLMDATLIFRVMDGFVPQTGDVLPFLTVAGGLTSSNLSLQFEGVADGFDFQVMESNGMLMFEALNDAQAISSGLGCALSAGPFERSTANPADLFLPFSVVLLMVAASRSQKARAL